MSVEAKTLQIIPAPPGWRVVRFDILNGDEIHARERPVLCLALVEREVDGEIERTVEPLAQDEFGDGAIYASTYRPIMAAPGVSLDEFFEMAVEEARRVQRLRANGKPMYVQQGDTLRKVDTPDLPRSSPPIATPTRPAQPARSSPSRRARAREETIMHTIKTITETTRDALPIDLDLEMSAGGHAYRFEVEGHAQPGFVLVVAGNRAGVAWGGNSTWIDLYTEEGPRTAAGIVLNDADETARRA